MLRLFAAIAVPPDVGETLIALQTGIIGARWRGLEEMHLTLRFFGDVREDRAQDLVVELERAVLAPFDIALHGVGAFGEGHRLRAAWAGVADSQPLRQLASRCEAAARRAGLEPEIRNYAPHVTLAYLTRPYAGEVAAWIAANNLLNSERFRVNRFGLYSSWAAENGSRYELERLYRLS